MTRRLQHEEVEISVLRGRTCFAFRAVENLSTGVLALFYLQVEGTWHRFYLDAGLLFWEEGPGPNPEEDLLEGDQYVDLGSTLGVNDHR
jgi:hypothetical protein